MVYERIDRRPSSGCRAEYERRKRERMKPGRAKAAEPSVDDLLSDPICISLMLSDGLTSEDVWRNVHSARTSMRVVSGARET